MKISKIGIGLAVAIGFQIAILLGIYIGAATPFWTGKEVRIKTIPVDPRSMFRGNYARLRYEISEIEIKHFPQPEILRDGERVYIRLKTDSNQRYVFAGASLTPPEEGVFIRGRIKDQYSHDRRPNFEKNGKSYFKIKYGIEAFFAKKEPFPLRRNWPKGELRF